MLFNIIESVIASSAASFGVSVTGGVAAMTLPPVSSSVMSSVLSTTTLLPSTTHRQSCYHGADTNAVTSVAAIVRAMALTPASPPVLKDFLNI